MSRQLLWGRRRLHGRPVFVLAGWSSFVVRSWSWVAVVVVYD